MDKKAVSIRQ